MFGLSELKGYRTGGTIHFIVNNQIGFTTSPSASRSSPYSSDVAKIVQAPIFHVNGDDPEAVVHVARIATEFRQEFKRDVVIDMFCYRRFGHNEADEPSFTQPIMYKAIAKHPSTREVYGKKLVDEGSVSSDEVEQIRADFRAKLEQAFEAASSFKPNKADWLQGKWAGLRTLTGEEEFRDDPTYASLDLLREVGRAISTPPKDFNVNRKILRLFDAKRKMLETGEGVDWAMGEALAYGTLLVEGIPVRLSGQDFGRGTFSHRHAVLVDQENEQRYVPLNHISDGQAQLEVIDSPLSEASVLGFEYGYSLVEPDALVLWEAQFGDFANGAQVIIDQFIAPGESKWLRLSGLVMLLPHGYEGQGPEHSSARPERYLQLCAEDNMQVVQLHDAGELLPRPAPADLPQLPQAADRDVAQVAASPQAGGVAAGGHGAGDALRPGAAGGRTRWSPTTRCGAWCCAPARSTTTCCRSGASAASTTSRWSGSSSSIPGRGRWSSSRCRSMPTPSSSGARRNRPTPARGRSSCRG